MDWKSIYFTDEDFKELTDYKDRIDLPNIAAGIANSVLKNRLSTNVLTNVLTNELDNLGAEIKRLQNILMMVQRAK